MVAQNKTTYICHHSGRNLENIKQLDDLVLQVHHREVSEATLVHDLQALLERRAFWDCRGIAGHDGCDHSLVRRDVLRQYLANDVTVSYKHTYNVHWNGIIYQH